MSDPRTRTIGIHLFPGVEELDAFAPWGVLSRWVRDFPGDGWEALTFSGDGAPVTCAGGLTVVPHAAADALPSLDVLLYPGGPGVEARIGDQEHLAWLRGVRESVSLLVGVCTGGLVLAAAGLLGGRPATTHWSSLGLLVRLDPTVEIRPGERFVDDGDLVTSAGVSAGLDMAVHLVARLASPERGREVRRSLQYDSAPPD
ncbi:DJ-1/PfpI family protein [Streptomyces sp. RFCAC02]|uniref:DJ-1/PfpI family protein n=1 Tax=Streptomyces sp. RFCAC02 TaxID=2499143 RepID=UPI00101EF33C|nr:DJ-1/PfpI family protein [Streptomyces sp. RFCAC02]